MATKNKWLIDIRDCPCDGCQAKPCGHPARCVKFALWLNKTVDAVEVVRCKGCEHWHEGTGWCDKHSHFVDRLGDFCYPEESGDWKEFEADYFCKDGKSKNEGRKSKNEPHRISEQTMTALTKMGAAAHGGNCNV